MNDKSHAALPLYSKVEFILRNKIINGQLQPGELLPSEQDLATEFEVSQITIRTALSHLKQEGLITRSRGKGSFIADKVPEKNNLYLQINDIYDIVRDASKYQVKLLDFQRCGIKHARYPKDIIEFFGYSYSNEILISRRLRHLKNNPVLFLENYIPVNYEEHLTKDDLSKKPILKALKEKIGLTVGRGEYFIEAIPADPYLSKILKAELFEPLISIKVHYWLSSGEPFEIISCFMRGEYFKFKSSISAIHFKDI